MINKVYFNKEILDKIKLVLEKEGSIQLNNFFDTNIKFSKIKFRKKYLPHSYSYSYSKFIDKEFINYLSDFLFIFLDKKLRNRFLGLFSFGYGDYTLLNDKFKTKNGYKIIIDFTNYWHDDFGGYHSFLRKNKEFLRLKPKNNSISIIKLDKNTRYFVKYINNKARKNKIYFIDLFIN